MKVEDILIDLETPSADYDDVMNGEAEPHDYPITVYRNKHEVMGILYPNGTFIEKSETNVGKAIDIPGEGCYTVFWDGTNPTENTSSIGLMNG